jgi:hypothetical protein
MIKKITNKTEPGVKELQRHFPLTDGKIFFFSLQTNVNIIASDSSRLEKKRIIFSIYI